MEEAYYGKYTELAEQYGTYSLYNFYQAKHGYSDCNYLSGVCIVNLMAFNGDGIQNLFVLYSNGQMNHIVSDGYYGLAVYDFPSRSTYEFEVWTYRDGALLQLLHESCVSECRIYPSVSKMNQAKLAAMNLKSNATFSKVIFSV